VARVTFVWSDTVAEQAAVAFAGHARKIRERLPDAEIRHTGGTSIRGVLTTGDVDLQVRTEERRFVKARDALSELYEPLYPEAWHSEGAFFFAPDSQPAVEVALTAIGSLDDLHHGEAWLRIVADPDLIDSYNDLKRAREGGSMDAYQSAKAAFFRDSFAL
jgi:GrpB-like predicted nucleotidyltransferase (UPF0157 family)